jgi:molecular chaperone GrpE
MSNEDDSIPVNVISENETNREDKENSDGEISLELLQNSLNKEKQKSEDLENKLKYAIADYQNLSKKTQSDIENGINNKISQFMLDFLNIYDDFKRAKEAFSKNDENTKGLDSIVKNMDSLLAKYNVAPIDALGEIFDPNLHEAISIVNDPKLDDNTIIKEIRKGYISQNRVIRPSLVEISKNHGETKNG